MTRAQGKHREFSLNQSVATLIYFVLYHKIFKSYIFLVESWALFMSLTPLRTVPEIRTFGY